ncbi:MULTISPECIES: shikimate dehydrogenase [Rhodococcus]|uniref:shikimate dehydrogenase n=1 Tax=Rhodococcus TaxID=1827 RepID=UPI0015623BDB|nr:MULTISPECIES: shikimate dehydrogenase [Rhodococcus]NRI67548.1 shikimate dehydrogenase [Rhodococcus sp. MS16]QXW01752.1 shikimate dehydrogenase [Rhodococcus globerulus]
MSETILCGLIGTGIGASLTPIMHEEEGRAQSLPYVYRILDLDVMGLAPSDIGELLTYAKRFGFRGLNITHPCKQLVIEHLDELSADAAKLGAVNTVLFEGGKAIGHNTDWSGFGRNFDTGLPGAKLDRVVQLGAGGAGAAVAYAALTRGARVLTLVDSSLARAQELARTLAVQFPTQSVVAKHTDDLADALAGADGLIHATPMGMAAHPGMAFSPDLLRPDLWVAEIVYRPLETELLRQARLIGAPTLSGGGMTVFQAVDAFRIFTGIEPDSDRMLAHMTALVQGEQAAVAR